MSKARLTISLTLEPQDNRRLADLCGQYDQHLRQLESQLGIEINTRGYEFQIIGPEHSVNKAEAILKQLYQETAEKDQLTPTKVHLILQSSMTDEINRDFKHKLSKYTIHNEKCIIKPRSPNQYYYLKNILSHDINFGIGPSGTGKTYLAVACAVSALEKEEVQRIILVRPAVEAGEHLGFLPGDLAQKVDPYLRPLYDALYEMLGVETVTNLMIKNIIEVAPLAFMRGRTLNDAFTILDESQNTTSEQMKMFLTRIGFGSKAVITGDITQIDLPKGKMSGLRHATALLKDVDEISFTFFHAHDVIRHPLVQRIVQTYEKNTSNDN